MESHTVVPNFYRDTQHVWPDKPEGRLHRLPDDVVAPLECGVVGIGVAPDLRKWVVDGHILSSQIQASLIERSGGARQRPGL
jgi:hypothetical protein